MLEENFHWARKGVIMNLKELWIKVRKVINKKYSKIRFSIRDKHKKLAEKYGYQPYMIARYEEMFDNELIDFLEGNEIRIPSSIRCNDLKIQCNELIKKLKMKGMILAPIPWAPHGFWVLSSPISIGSTHEYLRGYYQIQGPASMIPAYILDPKYYDVVLDAAAAPGVKTSQMAQLMKNQGIIIAVDISRERMKALRSNITRLGVYNVIAIRSDIRSLKFNKVFTKALLDAPCTGEGLIPMIPERKKSRSMDDLKYMSILQAEMLLTVLEFVKEGGIVMYSTCSVAPEENELVIDSVLEVYRHASIIAVQFPIGDRGFKEYFKLKFSVNMENAIRLYPYKHGTEGFFIAKIVKEG